MILIIILDCGDLKRTDFIDRLKNPKIKKRKIINIDHHPKNDVHRIASLNLVDYDSSSTAEIVYDIANELDLLITRDIATSLLCGIYTDTGAFQHSNTSPAVLKIASVLMHRGAQLKKISQILLTAKVFQLLSFGEWFCLECKNKIFRVNNFCCYSARYRKCQATVADLAGVVNLINAIPGSKASILFSEIENGILKQAYVPNVIILMYQKLPNYSVVVV
jgi:phosphoesterase RecJ-like protein